MVHFVSFHQNWLPSSCPVEYKKKKKPMCPEMGTGQYNYLPSSLSLQLEWWQTSATMRNHVVMFTFIFYVLVQVQTKSPNKPPSFLLFPSLSNDSTFSFVLHDKLIVWRVIRWCVTLLKVTISYWISCRSHDCCVFHSFWLQYFISYIAIMFKSN